MLVHVGDKQNKAKDRKE